MCEQEISKDNDQTELNISRRRVTANQRSVDGDDTGSDDDRMVICETQEDSSECSDQPLILLPIDIHLIFGCRQRSKFSRLLLFHLSVVCFSLKFDNSYWFLPPDDAEVARVEHGSQSEDATHGSQSEDATGGIDLNCREHVSDTETDSQSEDEALIENKRFPQQRFSPVQKHVSGSDITHRPKPIKMKPESPIRAELIRQVSVCSLYLLRLKLETEGHCVGQW